MIMRRERKTRSYYFEQVEGEAAPRRISLEKTKLIIGRSETADIVVNSMRASREHASMTRKGIDYVLRDENSHNGIFLNGIKIHSAVLREGDIVQIADSVFVYQEG